MSGPSVPTLKRLFAESGPLCAFAGCDVPVVGDGGLIMVDVCHISASSPNGPRYDPDQSDDHRHGYENLILLCPNHHRLVDSDPTEYSVEVLIEMKGTASTRGAGQTISDESAQIIARSMHTKAAVLSVGQKGGQTAHTIVNVGAQNRRLSDEVKARMKALLLPHAGATIGFASFVGDPEAASFKRDLMAAFAEADWDVKDQSTFMFLGDKRGVVLTIPFEADELDPTNQAAAAALDITGELLGGNRGDMANETGRYVQVWPT